MYDEPEVKSVEDQRFKILEEGRRLNIYLDLYLHMTFFKLLLIHRRSGNLQKDSVAFASIFSTYLSGLVSVEMTYPHKKKSERYVTLVIILLSCMLMEGESFETFPMAVSKVVFVKHDWV